MIGFSSKIFFGEPEPESEGRIDVIDYQITGKRGRRAAVQIFTH
jgi:hypothetical protein